MSAGPDTSVAPVPAGAAAFRVREARAGDLDAVMALDERVTGLAKRAYWHDHFEHFLSPRRADLFLFVAEAADGERPIVGFISGEVRAWEFGSPPCGWIFALSVDPEARLAGVGSRLLEAILEGFRETGVAKVRTVLSRDNYLLMSFFRSHGMMAGPYIELEMELG